MLKNGEQDIKAAKMTQDFDERAKVSSFWTKELALCAISMSKKDPSSITALKLPLCVLFPARIGLEKETRERERKSEKVREREKTQLEREEIGQCWESTGWELKSKRG